MGRPRARSLCAKCKTDSDPAMQCAQRCWSLDIFSTSPSLVVWLAWKLSSEENVASPSNFRGIASTGAAHRSRGRKFFAEDMTPIVVVELFRPRNAELWFTKPTRFSSVGHSLLSSFHHHLLVRRVLLSWGAMLLHPTNLSLSALDTQVYVMPLIHSSMAAP